MMVRCEDLKSVMRVDRSIGKKQTRQEGMSIIREHPTRHFGINPVGSGNPSVVMHDLRYDLIVLVHKCLCNSARQFGDV